MILSAIIRKLIEVCGLVLVFATLSSAQEGEKQVDLKLDVVQRLLDARTAYQRESLLQMRIQPGTESQAKDYYGRISQPEVLNFQFEDSTLDGLLAYMGYSTPNGATPPVFSGLLARDLEKLPSVVLMPRDDGEFANLKSQVSDATAFDSLLDLSDFQSDKVLVSRFFAPKIATYYDAVDPFRPVDPDKIDAGWRKIVRLTARGGSIAKAAGILHLYLLFNVKQKDPDADPFSVESQNNQVILVPSDQNAKDSAYFAIYGLGSAGYPVGYALAADFDLPGHVGVTLPGSKDGQYFVPRSCAECHGHSGSIGNVPLRGRPTDPTSGAISENFKTGVFRFAKPNYLDTDQWYDWMEFDFRGVATSLNDVVFDGGKAHGTPQYARALGVIRTLNTTICDQIFEAEQTSGVKTFSTLAAEKWLSLHKTDDQSIPYSLRSFGNQQWNQASRDEMRLLRLLDNHCFRCHSSVMYNVFDREAVKSRKLKINLYLTQPVVDANQNPLPGFRMPQGRVLKNEERDEISRLLRVVFP